MSVVPKTLFLGGLTTLSGDVLLHVVKENGMYRELERPGHFNRKEMMFPHVTLPHDRRDPRDFGRRDQSPIQNFLYPCGVMR